MFFKNILFTTQFDQTENCDHVAQLINYLNGNPVLSLTDFRDLLQKLSGEAKPVATQSAQTVTAQPVAQSQPVVKTAAPVQTAAASIATPQKQNPKPSSPQQTVPVAVPQQMQVPATKEPVVNKKQSGDGEKEISWFYLMQHYNKENAALYKAQQEAKKNKKGNAAPQAAKKPEKAVSASAKQPVSPGYAIPGQQSSVGNVAVPRSEQNATTNAGSACYTAPVAQQQMVQQPSQQMMAPVAPPSQGMPLNFGETTVLGGGIGETTVLGGGMPVSQLDPHLIRTKNNERIPLNKPVFRIGKERSYVDYFISDNTAISRSHANIVNHDGEFFVVDTNSTNHTYVNGVMIPSGQETKLAHGDKVRLANEDFEFRLY